MIRYRELKVDFPDIWRVFISGCSAAGKTFFAKQLVESGYMRFKRIYYFHPDFHENSPIDWNRSDMIFVPGCPQMDDLLNIPEYTCIILDDLFAECKDSKTIDYLFRVLSSKRKLHVLIMTQRYFSNGTYTLNIRNSCNIHVLMRNADELSNTRAARSMNLKTEVALANKYNQPVLYPYIFINKTNQARVSGLQVFIDIFSKCKKVVMKNSIWFLISERDFYQKFKKIDSSTAVSLPLINEDGDENAEKELYSSQTESETKPSSVEQTNPIIQRHKQQQQQQEGGAIKTSKRDFERRVRQVIRRYRKRAII